MFDAYKKYANRFDITSEVLDASNGHIVAKFKGIDAGKRFSMESGKHCIQRIPPTENNGRKQTSMVSVAVLPLPPENTLEPLRNQDLEEIFQTGSQGAGGQNVNRIKSAVRLKHVPTGLCVFINGRDQGKNRKEARRILTVKVNEQKRKESSSSYGNLRKEHLGDGGRGDKIRTYNWLENRAVDHRTGVKIHNVERILEKGEFELLDSRD